MGPQALAQVLRPLAAIFPPEEYPELLVGLQSADDAAVFRMGDGHALIATVDFFPPIVDDAFTFGSIAAANAMSDVFAMGGEVMLALNLLGWPEDLDLDTAARVLEGGARKVREAGAVVAGGHSVIDKEPKYGLAVIGRVDPRRMLELGGAVPGDVLVLTKPLGTGLVTTALKRGHAAEADVAAAVASMSALNRSAARTLAAAGVRCATDVTGFSLVGHALELADASGVRLRISVGSLPLLPNVHRYAESGLAPGGTCRNRDAYSGRVEGLATLTAAWSDVIFDPQTSGGLLAAVPPDGLAALAADLAAAGESCAVIGAVEAGDGILLE